MGRPRGSKNGVHDPVLAVERKRKKKEDNARARAHRRKLLAGLKDHPCVKCGGRFHPAAMDFHHRDPTTKDVKWAAWTNAVSEKKLHEEVAKCDVICATCHRILHAEERERRAEVMPDARPTLVSKTLGSS